MNNLTKKFQESGSGSPASRLCLCCFMEHTTGAASFFPETNMSQLSEHASQSVCLYILLLLASYERCLTYLMLFYFRYVDIINRK